MIRALTSASLVALALVISTSTRLQAQAPAPAPVAVEATPENTAAMIGDWVLTGTGQNGPMTLALTIAVTGGKLLAEITSDTTGTQLITGFSKVGAALVLRYGFDYQGMAVPVAVTLTPVDGKVTMAMDFAEGAYQVLGTAVKKEPKK